MEAEAAAVGQAPLMGYFRRNLASTVIVWTLGTLLIAGELQLSNSSACSVTCLPTYLVIYDVGGADWSRKGIQIWAYNKGGLTVVP